MKNIFACVFTTVYHKPPSEREGDHIVVEGVSVALKKMLVISVITAAARTPSVGYAASSLSREPWQGYLYKHRLFLV